MRLFSLILLFFSGVYFYAIPVTHASIIPDAIDKQQNAYVCPMHAHIVSSEPGNCPICGMELVKNERVEQPNTIIEVSGEIQQAMAITTDIASTKTLFHTIDAIGVVQFDETSLTHIHPRASGWIEHLAVNTVGQRVKKGELLYEIYSPDLLVAQEDFLSLLASKNKTPNLIERGKRRLRLLGLTESLIDTVIESQKVLYRVPYFAKQDSVVSHINIRQGMYVDASERMLTLANLNKVWVIADVVEGQAKWIKYGQGVEVDVPSINLLGEKGSIEFVYPTLDAITKTLQVRITIDNENELLKPDMQARARINVGQLSGVTIPLQALIQTEKRNAVFVKTDEQGFAARKVTVEAILNRQAIISEGLQDGDVVVTSGQFLLDAEASLSRVLPSSSKGSNEHHHSHHH